MKQNFLPTPVSETLDRTITMDDDIDVAIIKFMSTYKGYTISEVHRALEPRVADPEAITPTMLALNINGWFETRQLHAGSVTEYVLKRWRNIEELKDEKRPTVVRKFKQPDEAIVDPAGRILLAEGVDIGIWKAMSDRKWRTVRDVVCILREFGFNALMVDKRIGKLASNGKWFDRRGNSSRTYRLRPEVQCPSLPPVTAPTVRPALSPVEAPKVALEPLKTLVEAPPVKIEAIAVTRTTEPVSPGDHLYTAIWKVMGDKNEYTVSEIAVLLVDYGFTQGNISPAMSEFFKNGYVMRRDARSPNNRLQYAYRLKDMAMPAFKPKYVVDAPAVEAKPEVQTSTPEVPMHALLQPVSTVEDAPLLEFTLRIKGTPITLREFAQLYDELKNAGLLEREASKGGLLVQASYTIKGTVFTTAELTALVSQMETLEQEFNNDDPLA
jgi:DNA-binding transcriptional MerR regulator